MSKNLVSVILTFALLTGLTVLTVFYGRGYRVDISEKGLQKTGMIVAKSIPDGAKVYLDEKLTTATNNTVATLEPGEYDLRIVKDGYIPWEKRIQVFEELVTDITAILVAQAPRLEPLTNTGVRSPTLSAYKNRIAYFLSEVEKEGIYTLSLSGSTNIFGSPNRLLIADTSSVAYSKGEKIYFSPDDSEAIVQMNKEGYYLFNIEEGSLESPKAFSDINDKLQEWREGILEKRISFLEKEELTPDLHEIALNENTLWSPDEKKFLYQNSTEDGYVEYKVYNLEDPLPVGESRNYIALRVKKGEEPKHIAWYPDSFHLVLVDGNGDSGSNNGKNGTVSLIRIDGSNKTEIYSGSMSQYEVYVNPSGDKIIILASFKQNSPPDLYAISIR